MALRVLDPIGEYELTCDEYGCPRRMTVGTPHLVAGTTRPLLSPRLNWQTVGNPADNVHRCPAHRSDR
jgi:hypothetical protein